MVELKSPIHFKDTKGKAGISFKTLIGEGTKKELFDTDKILTIGLKKGECVALVDRNENFWELCRNHKGRYNLRRLKRVSEFKCRSFR